jgi:CMP-N-acetylneuraminic acid synthetase
MIIGMIPARMGSQRLKKKNLREIGGVPLITRAIRKCKDADVFDEVWVNSENDVFGKIATQEKVSFHKRPAHLANNTATSEDYVYEFMKTHPCGIVFQVHSIAPLLLVDQVKAFVTTMVNSDYDVLLSVVNEQIECAMDGTPVNFSYEKKQNSQELTPIQRVTWSITGWRTKPYIEAYEAGRCATYAGKVGFHAIDRMGGHIIKREEDLQIAEIYLRSLEISE